MSIAPISSAAAALRVQIIGAAQASLMQAITPTTPAGGSATGQTTDGRTVDGRATGDPEAPEPSVRAGQTSQTAGLDPAKNLQTAGPVRAPPADPVKLAAAEAKLNAAARQGGAAPLFANLETTQDAPDMPPAVREAAARVLAARLPTDAPVTAGALRQAVARSGLFLEARLAAQPQAPTAETGRAPQPQAALPLDLKAALLTLRQALGAFVVANPPAPRPQPVAQLAQTSQSAQTAQPATPTATASPQIAQPATPQTLAPASASLPLPATPQTTPRPNAPTLATIPNPLPGDTTLLAPQAADQTAVTPRPDTPPPVRQSALAGQPVANASLPAGTPAAEAAPVLHQEVEQALARQTLHQLASGSAGPNAAWMFELPIATPQGTAVAQFEIDRDGHAGGAAGPAGETWRARFSLDIEPLGPVHVQLSLSGGRTIASLWAERPESLALLRAQGDDLARDLGGDVAIQPGAPLRPTPANGHFVDRVS